MTEKAINKELQRKIISKADYLQTRANPIVHEKIIKEDEDDIGKHLVKSKAKVKEKYKYYICDYCGEEIKIENTWGKQTGEVVKFPASLTGVKIGGLTLALHYRCLKTVTKEFEEERDARQNNL